jgi:ADP-heptose:LPS heptosyltransferase
MPEYKQILIIVGKRVGDTVFYTPAFRQLHAHCPTLSVDVLALSEASAGVLSFNPVIRQLYLAKDTPLSSIYSQYDVVISMHDSPDVREYVGNFDVAFAFAKKELRWADSKCACQFLANYFEYPAELPGEYALYPQIEHFAKAQALLVEHGVTDNTALIGMHMGDFRMAKQGQKGWLRKYIFSRFFLRGEKVWPLKFHLKLVERLHKKYPDLKFILTGSVGEKPLAKYFSNKNYVIDIMGQTNILELAALMKKCKVFLSGDTGPMHVACAMNIPLIALFGKTNPADTGPHPPALYRVVIYQPAMEKITVDEVQQALERFIK